ncbi:hypothetical protein GCM10027321_30820 [Massilia terrae]|uniref:Uncharacterized protein n=1 Tax=Massilia terrae TaxID=1811224 RepID=A0ABT2D1C5_9BURK|nr:hypothetical protein [Massilia terrae]MCS0660039.1 hypothetical protein [Massilia terrae]
MPVRLILLFIGAALPALSLAAPAYQHRNELIQHVDAFGYRERDRAFAYVDGVQDAVAGKAWCATQPVKTDELATAPPTTSSACRPSSARAAAAPLLVAYLGIHSPCMGIYGPGSTQGHIDLVEPATMSDLQCASTCYWSSAEVWFWPLR